MSVHTTKQPTEMKFSIPILTGNLSKLLKSRPALQRQGAENDEAAWQQGWWFLLIHMHIMHSCLKLGKMVLVSTQPWVYIWWKSFLCCVASLHRLESQHFYGMMNFFTAWQDPNLFQSSCKTEGPHRMVIFSSLTWLTVDWHGQISIPDMLGDGQTAMHKSFYFHLPL